MRQESKSTWTKRKPKRVPYFRTSVTSSHFHIQEAFVFSANLSFWDGPVRETKIKTLRDLSFYLKGSRIFCSTSNVGYLRTELSFSKAFLVSKSAAKVARKHFWWWYLLLFSGLFSIFVASFISHEIDWYRQWLCILMMCHCVYHYCIVYCLFSEAAFQTCSLILTIPKTSKALPPCLQLRSSVSNWVATMPTKVFLCMDLSFNQISRRAWSWALWDCFIQSKLSRKQSASWCLSQLNAELLGK